MVWHRERFNEKEILKGKYIFVNRINIPNNTLTRLSVLWGEIGWQGKLLVLVHEDIQLLKEGDKGASEWTQKLLWIWKVVGITDNSNDEGVEEGVRV